VGIDHFFKKRFLQMQHVRLREITTVPFKAHISSRAVTIVPSTVLIHLQVNAEHVWRGPELQGLVGAAGAAAAVARDALGLIELLGLPEQAQAGEATGGQPEREQKTWESGQPQDSASARDGKTQNGNAVAHRSDQAAHGKRAAR
jgi:ribosomal protein L31E